MDRTTKTEPAYWDNAAREFPQFPRSEFPVEIPTGFSDGSWRNDLAPCLIMQGNSSDNMIRIWIDHKDSDKREYPELARYTVVMEDVTTGDTWTVLESESWDDVLNLFKGPEKLKDIAAQPIANWADGFRYLTGIAWTGATYHLEDSAASVVRRHVNTYVPVFDSSVARLMDSRSSELYKLETGETGFCPIFLMLILHDGITRAQRGGYA